MTSSDFQNCSISASRTEVAVALCADAAAGPAAMLLELEGGPHMVTTREVSVDDAETVTHMVAALLAELGAGDAPDTEFVAELLAMKERVHGFLAFAEGRPVGVIMLSESAALFARGTYATITELYVVPDQRSSGVAMRLIAAAVGLGRVKGWGQLELAAPSQPTWIRNPSLALYVKAGFAEIGPRLKLPLQCLSSPRAQGGPAGRTRVAARWQRARSSSSKDSTAGRFVLESAGPSRAESEPRPRRNRK